jgi:hypothetical protein
MYVRMCISAPTATLTCGRRTTDSSGYVSCLIAGPHTDTSALGSFDHVVVPAPSTPVPAEQSSTPSCSALEHDAGLFCPPFPGAERSQQLPPGFNVGGMPSGTTQQQIAALSQRAQVSTNNQVNSKRVIQAQDPSLARQFNMLLLHGAFWRCFFHIFSCQWLPVTTAGFTYDCMLR